MNIKVITSLVCWGLSPQILWAESWQETTSGTLLLQAGSQPGDGCAANSDASYLSQPLSGHMQYNRVRYSEQRLRLTGNNVPELQIEPLSVALPAATQSQPTHWGVHTVATQGQQSGYQFHWHDPDAEVLRSVQFKLSPLQWQPRWTASYQPSANAWLSDRIRPQRLADAPSAEWLLLPGDQKVPIRAFDAASGLPRPLPLAATTGSFALLPLTDDKNLDGLSERLYLLSREGVLWQYDWLPVGGWHRSVVADLQSTGWDFDGSLQRFSGRWQQNVAQQQGDIFVLLARTATDYRLVVLRRGDGERQTLTWADVASAPDLSKAGWQMSIPSRPVSQAKLVGGILYLPLKSVSNCEADAVYDRVVAAQLYSGAAAYTVSLLPLKQPVQAPLRLIRVNNEFQLWSGSVQLISQLQTLDPSCLMCTEVLTSQHLQGQEQLAVFQHEQVY